MIAEAFYLTGDIEKYGSGLIRIRKEIKEYPTMKMEFGEIQSGFLLTLRYTKQKISVRENEEVNVGVDVGVNVGVKTLLIFIENNPGTNALAMEKQFKVTQRTIERWIKTLREENKIEFKGVPKTGGYWKINTNVE
ncbi:hypothetical protein EKM00_12020 [Flavobacterium sp. RSP15]|nr:hypothetical protein EKM00_12020 [Flavobacterium sp. RSP15]